jgi:glycosyltransferase involved in cell wall biosynthesis
MEIILMIDLPLVSVIIPTYNSEKTIPLCIQSVLNQTYKNIEIIVVDNLSSDKTIELITHFNVKCIEIDASRSKARNIGIWHSKGFFVLCIDSDMELKETVVEECVNTFQNSNKVGGIIIPERSVGNNYWVHVRDFERSFYKDTEIESARFFQRDITKQVGGYEEDIIFYEESTLPQKIKELGYNVNVRINSEIFHHEYDFNIFKWIKKKFYYGKTLSDYKKTHSDTSFQQTNVINRFLIFIKKRKFYSKPCLAAGVIILKLLEYIMACIGNVLGRKSKE